jgi:hypothetical protein
MEIIAQAFLEFAVLVPGALIRKLSPSFRNLSVKAIIDESPWKCAFLGFFFDFLMCLLFWILRN